MFGLSLVVGRVLRPVARSAGEGIGGMVADLFDLDDQDRAALVGALGKGAAIAAGVAVSVALADVTGAVDTFADEFSDEPEVESLAGGADRASVTGGQDTEVTPASPQNQAGEVRFGWEGRYPAGVDGDGDKIIQSGLGPPKKADPTQGGEVSSNDVTWPS